MRLFAHRRSYPSLATGLLATLLLIGVAGGCPLGLPGATVPSIEGTWEFFAPAVNTQLTQFAFTLDDDGVPTNVTYKIADEPVESIDDPSGTLDLDNSLVTLGLGFDGNSLGFNGSLSGDGVTLSGLLSLVVQSGGVELRISQGQRTFTKDAPSSDEQSPLAGTWRLEGLSETAQLSQLLVEFDALNQPTSVTYAVGQFATLQDDTPQGETVITDDRVATEMLFSGDGTDRRSFAFDGVLEAESNVLDGTTTLRISAGDTTVMLTDQPALLVKLTPPPDDAPVLEGTWDYRPAIEDEASDPNAPTLESLALTFDADNNATRVVYRLAGTSSVSVTEIAGGASVAEALATINLAFNADNAVVFNGTLNDDQTVLNGRITVRIGQVQLDNELAVFTKR